jgi:thiol:disulfide interchange protein
MIGMLVVGLPFIGLSIWLYLRFGPKRIKERIAFELVALCLLALGIFLVSNYSYESMKGTTDSAWWPVLAFFYNLGFIPGFLLLSAFIRKLNYKNTEPARAGNG